MKLVIAPLAETKNSRQEQLEKCFNLAQRMNNERQQLFVVAGITVVSDRD